ncbi:antitoxin VbhA family protein [Aquincola sp. S2]|uniref:Antitoxin VbhA family protein n=1 Tax=Pseudaquabacterium terrae TaxID=2732868 RepID=A0ABX2ERW3_9BURK|nr:antitoxin VbhA family protein [Aquabacterium terrae]NRF71401.1 antitoxin VbhA family protein [Aquabacterium terrae]
MTTENERRHAIEQAIANTRIEGHEPTPEFMADMEAVAKGSMTTEQARAASLARALAADAAAVPPTSR